MARKAAHLSIHGDPLAPLGGSHHGGQNVYVKELTRHLGALGLDVDVYSRWEAEESPVKEPFSRGARVIRPRVGPPREIRKEKTVDFLPELAVWITEYAREHGAVPEIIHSHYYFSGAVAMHLKREWGVPLVHNNHSLGAVKQQALGEGDPSPGLRHEIEYKIFRAADRLIATAPHEKEELVNLYDVEPGKISVIPPGVNLDVFSALPQAEAKKDIGYTERDFLITYVGRIEKRKGLDTLLQAVHLAEDDDLQLVIVGGPPSEKNFLSWKELGEKPYRPYRNLVEEYGLESQVTFTGGKPQDQLCRYYSGGDVTVIPSYYEPFGLTALEALACGCSVIGSRVGGLRHTIQPNRVGLLFDPRDAGQLAARILALKDQPELNRTFRENARPYVEEHYSWRSVTKRIARLYVQLLEAQP